MTNRLHSLNVVLESNIREDDAAALISAIGLLRGVLSVSGHVAGIETHMAEQRAKAELQRKLFDLTMPSAKSDRG